MHGTTLGDTLTLVKRRPGRQAMAQEALRRVRLLDAHYVQSAEQEAFLQRYEDVILQKIV